MTENHQNRLTEDIALIDEALNAFLSGDDPLTQVVFDAMRYSMTAGGKRLRPVLTLEFCRALGGDLKKALPFACAVEMIHCYSLIHDDLPCMDDDDLRRGKPSCHIQFGEANALLAGDGLLTLAFQTLGESPLTHGSDPKAALAAVGILSRRAGVKGMIGGQVIDLESEGKPVEEPVLHRLHSLKTSALIQAACEMGAAAAGAGDSYQKLAADFGLYLGLAFQIIDDILDVIGDERSLGKPVGSDQENKKTTYASLMGIEESKQLAREYTGRAEECLRTIPDSDFLRGLTEQLLSRRY